MKYLLIFLSAMSFAYLMAAFYSVTVNPALWDADVRLTLITFGTAFSVVVTFALYCIEQQNNRQVIIRDPKTGRFKKK